MILLSIVILLYLRDQDTNIVLKSEGCEVMLWRQRFVVENSSFLVLFFVWSIMTREIETCSKVFTVAIRMPLECLDNCMCSFCESRPVFLDALKHTAKVDVMRGWGLL